MDFLEEYGVSHEVVVWLNKNCLPEEIDGALMCFARLRSSIYYLKSIGLDMKIIEEILMEDYHVLMPGEEALKRALSKIGEQRFVECISKNFDYYHYLKDTR